jgi:alpha-beta hydrolase superfamily lysophospholipase
MTIVRTPLYFGPGDRPLFGWVHTSGAAADLGIVVCPPFGHEYVNSHRSVRHLADRLAERGVTALRFDYDGTGDSAGDDGDAGRVEAWRDSIRMAMQTLRDSFGCTRIGLAGLRLGATLTASLAAEVDVECLVLWAPVVRGRQYAREMRALHLTTADRSAPTEGAAIEPGGFVLTPETQADISALNLETIVPKTKRVLIVQRDDLPEDMRLRDAWRAAAIPVEQESFSGYNDLFAPPHSTIVPQAAIDTIANWIGAGTGGGALPTVGRDLPTTGAGESILRFGVDRKLFGIVSEPRENAAKAPAILLANAGSTHHVGPNRLYVFLARALARAGFRVLRFDLPGLGDSVIDDASSENDPYVDATNDVIASAIAALGEQHAASFVMSGLCSGAHAAFHAAIELAGAPIVESVLINPLTFYYRRGMSLDQPLNRYGEWQWYMRSLRKRDRWAKLLRGKVRVRDIVRVAVQRLREVVAPKGDDLARDLAAIAASGKKVTFVFSRFDPGYDLLMASAGREVKRLRAQGALALWRIDDADHTFEVQHSRDVMIESLVRHLRERYLQ